MGSCISVDVYEDDDIVFPPKIDNVTKCTTDVNSTENAYDETSMENATVILRKI